MLTERGIEANPVKCQAIIKMKSPVNVKEVQALNGKLVALNRFLFRSTDNHAPFFTLLKNNKAFKWTDECEEAFKKLKEYLVTPPVLNRSELGKTLYIYLASAKKVVSSILIKEESDMQKPIYFIS